MIQNNFVKRKQIEEKDALIFVHDILLYLQFLASYNLSHGDLTPDHIYMDRYSNVKIVCPLLFTN